MYRAALKNIVTSAHYPPKLTLVKEWIWSLVKIG